jgi:rubredoxin
MKVVECPKCALRFEPGDGRTNEVFCPQCGNIFDSSAPRVEANAPAAG